MSASYHRACACVLAAFGLWMWDAPVAAAQQAVVVDGPACAPPWSATRFSEVLSLELRPFAVIAEQGLRLEILGDCARSVRIRLGSTEQLIPLADLAQDTAERQVAMIAARLVEEALRQPSNEAARPVRTSDADAYASPPAEGATRLGRRADTAPESMNHDVPATRESLATAAPEATATRRSSEASATGESPAATASPESSDADATGQSPDKNVRRVEVAFRVLGGGEPFYGAQVNVANAITGALSWLVGAGIVFGRAQVEGGTLHSRHLDARAGISLHRSWSWLRLEARASVSVAWLAMNASAAPPLVAESRSYAAISFPVQAGAQLRFAGPVWLIIRGGATFVARGLTAKDETDGSTLIRWSGVLPEGELGIAWAF